jgi:hypothetical protein
MHRESNSLPDHSSAEDLFEWAGLSNGETQATADPAEPESRADQIFAAFSAFHAEHPEVWRLFERFALEESADGRTHYSANALFERIRLHTRAGDSAIPKLNNNFRAYYARLFHAKHPELGNFFGLRRRVSEDARAYREDMQFLEPEAPGDESGLTKTLAEF